MTQRRQVDRQLVILVTTLLGGLLGALLGVLPGAGFSTVGSGLRVFVLLGGTVIGAGVAFFLLTADRSTADRPEIGSWAPPAERPAHWPPSASPAPSLPSARPATSSPPEPLRPSWPTVSASPVAASPVGQPNRARPRAPFGDRSVPEPPPSTEAARITLPLAGGSAAPSSYDVASALIAQCPRCGEFRLDVNQIGQDYAFRCRNGSCANTWSWTPGTPWPPVVVRRNLPGGSGTDRS